MKTYPSDDGKAAFVSLARGEDLLEGLNRAVDELGIQAATLQVIGGLDEAKVGYYDRDMKQYLEIPTGHVEIASGIGNVSLRDGEPFIHLHLALSGRNGTTIGGHALEGCKAFVVEAYFRKLDGAPPTREENPEIGLRLWPGR
ncbi:MAG TPA: PPC domain-containing DNA-binding protein [Actinomycetota bacterium]|nr:PPC domain-containing DNA-binding protein [Actinomycetota bacterium]